MSTLKDVKDQVRAILGDQNADWTPDEYLIPIINHIYELINLRISDTCSPYITKVVQLPGLAIGTTDLIQQQNDAVNQTLYGLINPYNIQWKQAGQPVNYFRNAVQKDILPNIAPGAPANASALYWEWREYYIYLTPFSFPIDLQVRGEFKPAPLRNETDRITLHPLLGSVLAEESAACVSRERANAGQMQAYELGSLQGIDDIANQLVRSQQRTTVRLGRLTGRGRGMGYGNGSGWGL